MIINMPGLVSKLLSLFTVLLIPFSVLSQKYEFRNFGSDYGLPQPYIYSISQDSAGHLWIGTGEGLSRFNGFDFRIYTTGDSLADNFITCSFTMRDKVFFGHMNGTVSVFDGRKFSAITSPDRSLSRITCISSGPGGSVWASTLAGGFYRIDLSSCRFEESISPGGEIVNTFMFTSEDELIAGTNSGLIRISTEGLTEQAGLQGSKVTSIIMNGQTGAFIIATENDGIYLARFNGDQLEIASFAKGTEVRGIQSICKGEKSDLWIATFGTGLVRLSEGIDGSFRMSWFNKLTGYPSDNVKTVWQDREGVIWGGNFGEGLTRIIPEAAQLTDFGPEYGTPVFSVAASDKYAWAGTGKGLIKTEIQTGKLVGFDNNLPSDTVSALYRSDGYIWAGTGRHGIFRISENTGKTTRYNLGSGMLENSVTAIAGSKSGVFAGTRKGLCEIDTLTGSVTRYTIIDGLPHNFINGLWYDRDGILWVTTRSSIISYLKDGRFEKMQVNLASGMITAGPVTGDWGNGIWIGTSGQGILVLGSDSVMNITTHEGLLSDFCYSISCDGRYVWVGHRGGLSRIDTGDLTIKHITGFGGRVDLQFNMNAAAAVQGHAFFGSDRGLATYDSAAELPVAEPFLPYITSIRINDDELDTGISSVKLPAGKYRIRIQFLAVSLKSPENVRYQTFLEGYDEDWSGVSLENVVVYNGLTGGKYRLLLRSFNSDGIVAKTPLNFNIVISLPMWKRWWFYPVLALLLGSIVLYYLKWKESQHRQEKRILEERVRERTSEIERQKNELAAQRDEIDEKNLSIMSSITYARQIQKAILPPREVLDKAFPENFVLHKPRDIVSGDFYWMAEKNNRIVFSVADCTGHGVPGAFMSLLGITLLNEIVNVNGIIQSDIIVSELRRRLVQAIQQSKSGIQTYDGMEISLCVFDPGRKKLQFTGGMNHMVKIRDGRLEVIRADNLDVSAISRNAGAFKLTEVECIPGDMIYLFSDGYQDQFGGEYNRKFLRPHFYTTLVEVHRLPVAEQKEALETKLMSWMKSHPQTDDITIVGIRMC